jgi:hypothetical protein
MMQDSVYVPAPETALSESGNRLRKMTTEHEGIVPAKHMDRIDFNRPPRKTPLESQLAVRLGGSCQRQRGL